MKILSFLSKAQIKEILRDHGYNPSAVRKVVHLNNVMEIYWHNGDPMTRLEVPIKITVNKRNKFVKEGEQS